MKLLAEIDGEQLGVELRRDGERAAAEVDGRAYELEVREPEPGVFLITAGGRVFEARVAESADGATEVRTRGGTHTVRVSDPRRLRGARGVAGHDAGRAELHAPMPGKVVRVLVEEGAEVEAGDGVVVVEAMKMQNELKSPKAGRVARLAARVGETVNPGDVLAVIE
ncbi:MAG TPA: biotin/lipoyl-containing protein [Pyrinomonadaceae bacterium]|nr:biotin/lipoyl-containing protein [Pyrinomonadaceae bacterium]